MPTRAQLVRFAEFVALQGVAKAVAVIQGLVVIHLLSKWEYGLYALLLAVVMATGSIAVCGVGMFVSAAGGRHVHDPARMGSLYAAGRRVQGLLVSLGAVIVAVLLPVQFHAMELPGATLVACLTMLGLLLLLLHARATLGRELLAIALHLRANQVIDLSGSLARLALIAGLHLAGLLDLVTLLALNLMVSAVTVAVQERLVARWVTAGATSAIARSEDLAEARRIVFPQLPNAGYSSIQDQIPYLLMAWIGTVQNVAEYAAIGRIGMIFSFLFEVMSHYFMPRVARCQDIHRLPRLIFSILISYWVLIAACLLIAYVWRGELVWLLGRQYANLESDIPLMLAYIGIAAISGSLFAVNSCRAWLGHSWVFIISTITSQVIAIPLLPLDTLAGMLLFGMVPHIPFILINALFLHHGLRRNRHDLQAPVVP
jgi:hypothetical protein